MPQTIYGLDAASMKRTIRAVKKIEKLPSDLTGATPGKNLPSVAFWAKITGNNASDGNVSSTTGYSWQKMFPDNSGALQTVSGATGDSNAFEVNGLPCPTGLIVWLRYGGAGYFQFSTPAEMFPVQCTVDGGDAGSFQDGTTCSYTYTVKAEDNSTQLATGKTPDVPRIATCKYDTITTSPGIGYYDTTGMFHLYSVAKEKPSGTTVTNITDIRVVDSIESIQIKTQDQLVLDSRNKTDWITIYTGVICS